MSSPSGPTSADHEAVGRALAHNDNPSHPREMTMTRLKRLPTLVRSLAGHVFSNVGLSSLMIGYAVVGALTFEALESPHELEQRMHIRHLRKDCLHDLWDITVSLNVLYESNWTHVVSKRLRRFELSLINAVKSQGYDGREDPASDLQWSFSGALLYSVTVVTTIGYGTIAPKTTTGKMVTIFYALLGIPLMLLCLTNIGDILAQSFANTYNRLHATILHIQEKNTESIQNTKSAMPLPPVKASPSPDVLCKAEVTTAADVVIDSMKQDASLNMDDNDLEYELDIDKNIDSDGLPYDTDIDTNIDSAQESPMKSSIQNAYQTHNNLTKPNSLQIVTGCGNISMKIDSSCPEHRVLIATCKESTHVPVILVSILVSSYILGGALLFSLWEGWTFLNGVFFCFTTLSTIGFGDLVPGGTILDVHGSQIKTIICCLYLIIGLAIIAMSFNLVQEQVMIRCKHMTRNVALFQQER